MTAQDHQHPLPYAHKNSIWPMEIGGPRRQKHARSPGLNIQAHEKLVTTKRQFDLGLWVLGTLLADDKVYVIGCCVPPILMPGADPAALEGSPSYGWIEQIDPVTLECIKTSPQLPSGGHNWCGGGLWFVDGSFLMCNGRYVHKLNADLEVIGELKLPVDHAHNGMTILSDGMIVTRNLGLDKDKKSWFTVFDPNSLEVVHRFEFVGRSIGRFTVDAIESATGDGVDHIYSTTDTDVHRLIYKDKTITLDESWSASYMLPGGDQGYAWCNVVSNDNVWFMDMGDNKMSRQMMEAYPVGSKPLDPGDGNHTTHHGPLHVFRVSTKDSSDMDAFTPFGDGDANISAAPLFVEGKNILVAFDTHNGKTGAWRYEGPDQYTELWVHNIRNTNQFLYFPDTGELMLDDLKADFCVDGVVVDIETGEEKARVDTQTMFLSGMAWGPGYDRDVYSGSGMSGALYRLHVAE